MSAKTGAERARLSRERKEAAHKDELGKRDARITSLELSLEEFVNKEVKTRSELAKTQGQRDAMTDIIKDLRHEMALRENARDELRADLEKEGATILREKKLKNIAFAVTVAGFVIMLVGLAMMLSVRNDRIDILERRLLSINRNQWHTETPPVEVKLSVVTYAWYNDKGEWQSYSNGSVIDVLEWRPE